MQLMSLEHHWEGSISNHGIARQAATFSAQWKSLPIAHWSSKSHVSLRSEFQRVRLQKNSVEKLCRWASKFQGFRYIIKHLPGDDNLWADMLCRWIPKPFKARTVALLQRDFSLASIIEMQQLQEQSSTGSLEITSSDGVLMFMDKVWVPDANNLRLQICIVGHCGTAGHLYFEGTQRRVVLLRIFRRGYQIFMRQLHSMHSQWQAIYPSNCGRSSTWKGTEPSSSLRVSLYSGEAQAQQPGSFCENCTWDLRSGHFFFRWFSLFWIICLLRLERIMPLSRSWQAWMRWAPLSVVFDPGGKKIWDCPMSKDKLKEYMRDLTKSLDEINKSKYRWR